jgi:hypothetical protein
VEKELEERLVFLEESNQSHINFALRVAEQTESINIYTFMVLRRSLSLVFGFTTMIRERNFLCAAPLIRLQIDNLLRLRAAFLVTDQSQFVADVIQGKEVRQIKDRLGNKMCDAYLQDVLSGDYFWLKETYKKTSGYIHLSDAHFFNTIRFSESGEEGSIEGYIGPDDQFVGNEIYHEAVEDMIEITYSLLSYIHDWIASKGKS